MSGLPRTNMAREAAARSRYPPVNVYRVRENGSQSTFELRLCACVRYRSVGTGDIRTYGARTKEQTISYTVTPMGHRVLDD
jgi:hypothetical protein